MAVIRVNLGFTSWGGPYAGSFRPYGPVRFHGDKSDFRSNPPINFEGGGEEDPVWAARIMVGLSVGRKPKWTMDDVVAITSQVRVKQTGHSDASFVYQRGLYTQMIKKKLVHIDEGSVQIGIVNLADWGVSPAAFKKQIIELAETLERRLKQDTVIVEIQRNGILQSLLVISP